MRCLCRYDVGDYLDATTFFLRILIHHISSLPAADNSSDRKDTKHNLFHNSQSIINYNIHKTRSR